MKATIESTDKIVQLIVNGMEIRARVWEGITEGGVPFHAFITRVAVKRSNDNRQFERELEEQKPASVEIQAIPFRLVL